MCFCVTNALFASLRQWRGDCLALANASSYFCGFAGVTLLMLATPGLEYHTSRVDPRISI